MPNENTTPVITRRYYPTLASIVSPEDFPDILGFIKEGITNLFDKIHYKDLQYNKSPRGDAAFYSLSIVSPNRIDIEIPGTGIYLVLNPDIQDNDFNISAFPITVEYEWEILAYLREFSLGNFSFAPQEIFEIALRVLNLTEEQAIAHFINTFTEPLDGLSLLQQFKQDVEQKNGIQLINVTEETRLTEVVQSIYQQTGKYATLIGFATYLINNDLDETWVKLKEFFRGLLPEDIDAYVKNILVPKFRATLLLSAALEFPRNILQPVYPEGHQNALNVIPSDEDGDPKVLLSFGEALFYADTEKGFGYNMELVLNTNVPAQIGNTGLIIEIQNLKVDLSRSENFLEADLDNRPPEFMGVYMDYSAIILPKKWFDNEDNHPGTTAKLAGYNLLIGTGGISGKIALEAIQASTGTITDFYEDCFSFQYPVDVISNSETATINNYGELLVYLNQLQGASYQFKFPLTTILPDGTVNENMNSGDFAMLLSSCNSGGTAPRLVKKLGGKGFEIWFTSFDITFQQGKVSESNIQGGLKIPKLKDANGDIANIDIYGHIDDDGGFNITAAEQDGFAPIKIPKVLDLYINSLEVGRESSDEPFYIGTACDIVFTNAVIKKFIGDQKISVERLRIYSDGSFEIVGGAIAVPTNFTLNLGPVEISITGINFGSFQEEHNGVMRKYNFFGFDGGISLGSIGVEARGEGVKYFFTVDDGEFHSYIKIETIKVDLTIPGNASAGSATAIINGWLSISDVEYAGGISLKLPKLKMAGGADMRLQPKPPAFLIDAYLDIPIPIPLAATGLGITGFRGLFGFRYVAEKEAIGLHSHNDKWYDYYTHPRRGIHVSKFNGPDKTKKYKNAVSIGAGITIATMGSSDIISLRVMVLLSIPNMLMIDGRASILSGEWGLDDSGEPPFFAFMILADNGIEVGAGVDFKLPQSSGSIIDLRVNMEAGFFWDNPSGWYLNMGTREDPIRAKVLSLVEMESFLMLSSSGIEAGAKVSFDIDMKFGPIGVKAWFLAEVGGYISFERPQIGGYMTVDAGAIVDLFGIVTVGVSFYVHFASEAANPFLIYAEVRVCGRIKIWFVKINVCANVKIKWEKSRRVDRTPIPPITPALKDQAVKGVHMLTGETFELIDFENTPPNANDENEFNKAIIPLDTYIDIKFDKALLPGNVSSIIGSYNNPPQNYEDLIPPVRVIKGNELRQVKHRYEITNIVIKAAKEGSSTWVEYHPYEAVVSSENRSKVDHLRIGHWQKSSKEYNAIRLLATSPFSYTEQGEPGWFIPEQIGLTPSSLFCQGEFKRTGTANWLENNLGRKYYTKTSFPYYHTHQRVFFNISQGQTSNINGIVMNSVAEVVNDTNSFGFAQSLKFPNTSALEFKFNDPIREINLKLSSDAEGVKIIYYKSFVPNGGYLTEYIPVDNKTYTPLDIENSEGINYTNTEQAISKIAIYPISAIQSEIDAIYEQIEALYDETYKQLGNDLPIGASVETPLNATKYFSLLDELKVLQGKGCYTSTTPPKKGGIGYMQIQQENFTQRRFEVGKTLLQENRGKIYCQIYNEIDEDNIDEYRFRVFNFKCEIILSSSTRYHSKEDAINELEMAKNNILFDQKSILIKKSVNGKWYFNIIDKTGEVIARRIKYFETEEECLKEIEDLKTILRYNDFSITNNVCIPQNDSLPNIGSSCDPCGLHEVLLNHYNNCFTEEAEGNENYNIKCLEEFLNFITGCGEKKAPVVTGISFPNGNCCENIELQPPTVTGIIFPTGNCCESNGGTLPSNLSINSSIPISNGTGTLDFIGGVPDEVLDLEFNATFNGGFGSLSFVPIGMVAVIDPIHKNRTGKVTIGSNGKTTYNYTASGNVSCVIKVISRSSGKVIPSKDSTTISYNNNSNTI